MQVLIQWKTLSFFGLENINILKGTAARSTEEIKIFIEQANNI